MARFAFFVLLADMSYLHGHDWDTHRDDVTYVEVYTNGASYRVVWYKNMSLADAIKTLLTEPMYATYNSDTPKLSRVIFDDGCVCIIDGRDYNTTARYGEYACSHN